MEKLGVVNIIKTCRKLLRNKLCVCYKNNIIPAFFRDGRSVKATKIKALAKVIRLMQCGATIIVSTSSVLLLHHKGLLID